MTSFSSSRHLDKLILLDTRLSDGVDWRVCDVLTASCDAPILFQTPVKLGVYNFVDGALGANCPLEVAVPRLRQIWRRDMNRKNGKESQSDYDHNGWEERNNESGDNIHRYDDKHDGTVAFERDGEKMTLNGGIHEEHPVGFRGKHGNDTIKRRQNEKLSYLDKRETHQQPKKEEPPILAISIAIPPLRSSQPPKMDENQTGFWLKWFFNNFLDGEEVFNKVKVCSQNFIECVIVCLL